MHMEPEQETENRSARSGASKRKKRKEQLDEWNKLQSKLPRLLSFGFHVQNEPNHSTLQGVQAGNLETAVAEHQCVDVVDNVHDSMNETEPSATMLPTSSDPCSSSQSSRPNGPIDECVPISMLQAPLDVCISVHSCDTSCSSSQSSQSYSLETTATANTVNDPAKWTVTDNLREYWALHGPTRCHNNDGRYTASKRKDAGGLSRMVTENMFKRILQNGDTVSREWLIYSPSIGCLFCFVCKLFGKSKSALADKGFDDWKHAGVRLSEHEHSSEHTSAMLAFCSRRKNIERIDSSLQIQFDNEVKYWRNVLKRVVHVITFLSERGLAFRGDNEIFGSQHNGNYLGILELISNFDPFLSDHIARFGNAGSGTPSYLSSTICEEIVQLMGKKVLHVILEDIRKAKYFSISIDSTPDLAKIDQLTIIIRFVDLNGTPVERFLSFIPITSHTGRSLADVVLLFCEEHSIDFSNCRGQSYDNASNMSGIYKGVQTLLSSENPHAIYIPCAGHSLNLVGNKAADCCIEAISFFGTLTGIYNFFSSSTYRWDILHQYIGKKGIVVKRLSDTRWSARHDATKAFQNGYFEIQNALDALSDDSEHQQPDGMHLAKVYSEGMDHLETVLLTDLWNTVLERFNKTNKSVQAEEIELGTVVTLLEALSTFLISLRSKFDEFERRAIDVAHVKIYKDVNQRKRRQTAQHQDINSTTLHGRDKFRVETFFRIIDTLITECKERTAAYLIVNLRFRFLTEFHDMSVAAVEEESKAFVSIYGSDIDDSFPNEMMHFIEFIGKEKNNAQQMLSTILKTNVISSFPNVTTALRIYLSLMCTNCSGERSFSRLALLKNKLRTTMSEDRLNYLAIMSIESDITKQLDYSDVINEFANAKSRKRCFQK